MQHNLFFFNIKKKSIMPLKIKYHEYKVHEKTLWDEKVVMQQHSAFKVKIQTFFNQGI